MKRVISIISSLVLSCAIPVAFGAVEILDKVIAVVDDDVIMDSELQERLTAVKNNIALRNVEAPPEDVLIRQTLDRLILESIQLQMGARYGIRIEEQQMATAVARLAGQNGLTPEQFITQLEASGGSYADLRDNIGREMIIQRVQSGNVNQRIEINAAEIDAFLQTSDGEELVQPVYRLLHARLDVPETLDFEAARTHAEVLGERIKQGEEFNQVIASSEEPYLFTGGDLGLRPESDIPSLFAELVPTMLEGESLGPIINGRSVHFIDLTEKRGGTQIIPQTSVRHILIQTSEIMTSEQAQDLAATLKQRALAGEDFAELAREYSKDIGSAQEGGDLGWASPGQMVPAFETVMAATAKGDISEPFESPFGWHILQVLERRDQDVTEIVNRNRAEDFLHNRKFQEELEAWLQQIRDEAFVDIK
jgi:peptidyl-prolyl cis-trans isomerase SurA